MANDAAALQMRLMTLAHDILTDVKDAGDDHESLQYAVRRAMRRLRVLAGGSNPDTALLQGIADRARMKDVSELGGLLDEMQLATSG